MLLLDDVFDTLDAQRTGVFLDLLQTDAIGQSIITAAQRTLFNGLIPFEQPQNQVAQVVSGAVHTGVATSS